MTASTAHADGINRRQRHQERRIVRGVRIGELTGREYVRLEAEQARLDFMEARFRQSGDGLSYRERARLQRQLNRTSRDIYRQTHDNQDR